MNNFVLSVSQLNTYIKSVLDGDNNLTSVYIKGEISNFTNHYSSGHFYFSLKDEKSIIKAIMFKNSAMRIKFTPQNGMSVIVRGRISVFEQNGIYQIYAEDMLPSGAGSLQIAFEQLKEKLSNEGLFDGSHKNPIPKFPKTIGIITSKTGAAIEDMKNILSRRFKLCRVILAPVLVQGDSAPSEIIAAINKFNELNNADLLIIGRGGGSIEDLWAFNDEGVARAIFNSSIPVISAVGHETDFTIADFVADLRAPTPSAAAELAVPDTIQLYNFINSSKNLMHKALINKIETYKNKLNNIEKYSILSTSAIFISNKKIIIDSLNNDIKQAFFDNFNKKLNNFNIISTKLDLLSPLKILSRGYNIASKNNIILKNLDDYTVNDNIKLKITDGTVNCKVIGKSIKEEKIYGTSVV